jgi:16S rRNA (uracil1498-N3)-methyltransferase
VKESVTPQTARAHAFVDDLDAPVLTAEDHRHFIRVLRLPVGADVTVSNGRGEWRGCGLQVQPALRVLSPVVSEAAPSPPVTVAFALVKGERPELVVQKLTELGVDRIVPFVAERSVVRWDADKAARNAARWREIARQAAMQCRRTWLPVVSELLRFADVAALPGAVRAAPGGAPPSLARTTVLVGPEGGWSPAEAAIGLPTVGLGPHVLRAETAAITTGAIFAALRSGLVATV